MLAQLSPQDGLRMFALKLFATWDDMDFNGHMRNSAYLDCCSNARLKFFESHGFTADEFARHGFGPAIMSDSIRYFRELRLLDEYSVTLRIAGLAPNGSRFDIENEIIRVDGELCCRVRSVGGWLDFRERKLIVPPRELVDAFEGSARTEDYKELKSSAD
ncbi:MAG: thioesterase family protein [Woeseiaceae bacterium]